MKTSVGSNKIVCLLKPILRRFHKGSIYIVPVSQDSSAVCKNVELERIKTPRSSRNCFSSLQNAFSAFSTAIAFLGALTTLIAIWLKADTTFWTLLNLNVQQFCSTDYIGIGAAIFIIGLTGLYISNDKNVSVLKMYFCLMLILVTLEVTAVGVMWFVVHDDQFENRMADNMQHNIKYPNEKFYSFMDLMQLRFGCCGARGRKDYQATPISCYDPLTDSYFEQGCVKYGAQYVQNQANFLGAAFLSTLVVQVGAVVCTLFLICKLQRTQRQRFYYATSEADELKRPMMQ